MINIVLVNPQIPPNTGNIARTCAATKTPLHIIGPIGFEINDKHLKRAGLDYWPYVDFTYHNTIKDFISFYNNTSTGRWICFTKRGEHNYSKITYKKNDWLFFGSEIYGLPSEILKSSHVKVYIPMIKKEVRSLNLAVSVGIGLYEAFRQIN